LKQSLKKDCTIIKITKKAVTRLLSQSFLALYYYYIYSLHLLK
ncbi:hypothetical protein A5836_002511, partial [Enterococcus faecium]